MSRENDLLSFTNEGVLPPRDYPMTLEQLEESILVNGPANKDEASQWDARWRLQLVKNLRIMVGQLWEIGIDEIFIDGSFVEDKDHPNDIDGYFICDELQLRTRALTRELNRLDPAKCWTWDHATRRAYRGYPKKQLPMWHTYRVELYPHFDGLVAGVDSRGNALEFPAWFRQRRTNGQAKGIVKIIKS